MKLMVELDSLKALYNFGCQPQKIQSQDQGKNEKVEMKPTGWHSVKYDCVQGKFILNRAHCIGWQLGAENDNEKNLVSGTRYMNLEMLGVRKSGGRLYTKETKETVMYGVTPVFKDKNTLQSLPTWYSVEDKGEGVSYCVFFYNVQSGIEMNYQTGESKYTGVFLDTDSVAVEYDAKTSGNAEEGKKVLIF